jgi:glucose/arabinose dehydrogenase
MSNRKGLALVTASIVAAALAAAGAVEFRAGARAADPEPTVSGGFRLSVLAHVPDARELAMASNGDLFVGTGGSDVYVVPDAEGSAVSPRVFATVDDAPAAGVALGDGALFVGGQFGVWRIPLVAGDRKARSAPVRIARVRTSGDGGGHQTTSVAFARGRLYASVGSSCDACDPELDATRATIQQMDPDGKGMRPKAVHIRNAIALAVDGSSGTVWAGVAGQDYLPHGHPYEIFDPFTVHAGVVDYGWPRCYDDHRAVESGVDCSHQTVPRVVFPAYDTPIGAVIYPAGQHGRHAFPAAFASGAFVTLHGSWHIPPVPPRVAFAPLEGDAPRTPVDWNDPAKQWREFVGGFQHGWGRIGRPTGVAVGPEGSLFVADDRAGVIYRIRPAP